MTGLLAEILAWCDARPRVWPLPEPEAQQQPMTFVREADGTVTVEGEPLSPLVFTAGLLDTADPALVTFADGVLTLNVNPAPLRYRPLGPDRNGLTVMFERVEEA